MEHLTKWLEDAVPGIRGPQESASTSEQLDKFLLQNCILVGSPIVNPASEMASCRVFGAKSFSPEEIVKLPFSFRILSTPVMAPSSIVEAAADGETGIWLRDENHLVQADSWPREKFRSLDIKEGKDCALVVVTNHQTSGQSPPTRKLLVLSGFGGVGTEAAANALIRHYRDLEPRDAGPVWGIIQVFYRKQPESMTRELLGYNWRCREGGRCPLDLTRKKAISSAV